MRSPAAYRGIYHRSTMTTAGTEPEPAAPAEPVVSANAAPEPAEPAATAEPGDLRAPARAPADTAAPAGTADAPASRTILDLIDDALTRYAERPALRLWNEDGSRTTWTYAELDRRSRLAAWRLRRQLGLAKGDRILTWSPSEPGLPAVYIGAMRAGLVLVPLDLRMSSDAIQGIVARAEPRHLILGTGQDAPDPSTAGLQGFPTTTVADLVAEPDEAMDAHGWQ